MRCKACQRLIDPYLDGALPEGERGVFESHVAGCADCAAELERSRALVGLMADGRADDWVDTDKAWTAFRSRVAREDQMEQPGRRSHRVLIPAAVTGAVAAAAVAVAIWGGDPRLEESTEIPVTAEATVDIEAPAKELVEVLVDLDLYQYLDFFEGVHLRGSDDLDQDLALLEELLEEVEG
jgi:anti-sigma factor RsiW